MGEFVLRLKFRCGSCGCVACLVVPWTDVLADITAKDVMPDGFAEFFWNVAALLNSEISDAAAGVHLAGCEDGLCGTGIDTARATSATVSRRHIGLEFQRGQHHTQEEPRTQLLIDDAGVLANPAYARIFGIDAFHDGTGIHITAGFRMYSMLKRQVPDRSFHLLQSFHERVMIVL